MTCKPETVIAFADMSCTVSPHPFLGPSRNAMFQLSEDPPGYLAYLEFQNFAVVTIWSYARSFMHDRSNEGASRDMRQMKEF